MKSKTKLLIALSIVLALIAGFFIGTTVHMPSADKSGLAGTISKVNNYRNVKVSESDIKLRSELLNNEKLCKQLQSYFTFYYAANVQMKQNIDEALKAAEVAQSFANRFTQEVKSLSGFNGYLNEARKDYLLLLSALGRIKDTDQQSMGMLISNASNAVAQTKFRNQSVIDFTDAITEFFKTETPGNFPGLLAVHDALLLNLINSSVVTRDKMMIKFLDKKEFLGSKENIQSFAFNDKTFLNNTIISDVAALGNMISASDKASLNNQALNNQALNNQALNNQALNNQALNNQALNNQALNNQALNNQALNNQSLNNQALNNKDNLQSNAFFNAEALNLLFLGNANQYLSSQTNGLEANVYFDAHTLESSASFNDKQFLNSSFLQDVGVLNTMFLLNASNLGSSSNKE